MATHRKRRRILLGVAAVALLGACAYAGFSFVQQREIETQVRHEVVEAAARLEPLLGVDINAPTVELIRELDKAIAATDAALGRLRAGGARQPPLIEAADEYVAAVLNVLKRQAGSLRGRLRFGESYALLTEHLQKAGQRGSQWLHDAVSLRRQLDRDFFDYSTAAVSLGNMLMEYPAARAKVAAFMPAVPLPADALVEQARQRALAAAEATKVAHARAKQLVAPG